MTSQIAVFNQECVAVASDSVVTITDGRNRRTLPSRDKMHDLGAKHRIVVLGSGEARFMRVPWSLLISEWRQTLVEPLATVAAYAEHLEAWLQQQTALFTESAQEDYFQWQVNDYYGWLAGFVRGELEAQGLDSEPWDDVTVQTSVVATIDTAIRSLASGADLPGLDDAADAEFLARSAESVREALDSAMDGVPRTVTGDERLLREVPALILGKHEPWGFDSTLAFVGYGEDDLFPGHYVVEYHGLVNGRVRALPWQPSQVSVERSSMIVPFAQADAIDTFLQGYHADVRREAHDVLDDLCSQWDIDVDGDAERDDEEVGVARAQAHEAMNKALDRLAWDNYISPMLSTIDGLPPTDMARMAEALVGVQALRAASSGRQPGVGGPIDVALISRDAGVTWLRRKPLTLDGAR